MPARRISSRSCSTPAGAGRDASSIKRALVSGAAFPPSLRDEITARGVDAYQAFATADLGFIALRDAGHNEARKRDLGPGRQRDLILEIVRPGTGEPVAEGEVGEIVVTSLDPDHPWIRLALGDLSAVLAGHSPCGRTNLRIKGWMGRADQTTKIKGMFVRPDRSPRSPSATELARLRLVVGREGETDAMTLRAESAAGAALEARRRHAADGDQAARRGQTGRAGDAAERRQGDHGRTPGGVMSHLTAPAVCS